MTNEHLVRSISHTITAFNLCDPQDWPELADYAVVQLGGSLILPNPSSSWASHMAELSLLGIAGRGDTLEAAVRDWLKAAQRSVTEREAA